MIVGQVQVRAQGDQILDGIGETGLIARYVFDKDAKDWSRNNLHAEIKGDAKFVKDELFKNVLAVSYQFVFSYSYIEIAKKTQRKSFLLKSASS